MSTLIYSPGVRVYIDTERHGIVDVSEDIRDGSVTLGENQLSSLRLSILNHRRKYDGVFTPNDRVHVQLKRITWLPIMSGYLNQVPYFSVYPRTVVLSASCTLKRLKYRFWDSGSQAAAELLRNASPLGTEHEEQDGGLRDKVVALLTQVADWPERSIHIGRIPDEWAERTQELRESVQEQINVSAVDLGQSGLTQGRNLAASGKRYETADGPGTGQLPKFRGKVRVWENINRELDLTAPERGGPGAVGTPSGFADEWYVAMRWPYYQSSADRDSPSSEYLSKTDTANAKRWWKNRRILVINPANDRGVVLRAADWGPNESSGQDIGVSERALDVLGASHNDTLEVRFAEDGYPLGPLMRDSTTDEEASGSSAGETYQSTPSMLQGASGISFTSERNLKGNTAAARRFIQSNWDPFAIGGYRETYIAGSSRRSDHWLGLALDIAVNAIGTEPDATGLALGNAVAQWFISNPDVFGTKYVIWRDRINTGTGWRPYRQSEWQGGNQHPDVTQGHRDHVHISFENTGQTEAGPQGNPWPGTDDPRLNEVLPGSGIMIGSGFAGVFGGTGPLLNASLWVPTFDPTSELLTGPRRLLNDQPLLPTIARLTQASMRSHMAAPNGDFIAWFPDYFGIYGTAGKMKIKDIELANEGFAMAWDDANLVTHQFTAGSFTGYQAGAVAPGAQITLQNQLQTEGIATVEFPELMEALFNISNGDDPRSRLFRSSEAILNRFGARVSYDPLGTITGPEAEFWYAVFLFQRAWASQFSSEVSMTFMPEVYPGMLLQLEGFGLQVYVTSVTHTFSFQGGGFSTNAMVVAPSTTDRNGLYGLPLAGDAPPPRRGPGGGTGSRII